jgi:hypothetical protein
VVKHNKHQQFAHYFLYSEQSYALLFKKQTNVEKKHLSFLQVLMAKPCQKFGSGRKT